MSKKAIFKPIRATDVKRILNLAEDDAYKIIEELGYKEVAKRLDVSETSINAIYKKSRPLTVEMAVRVLGVWT